MSTQNLVRFTCGAVILAIIVAAFIHWVEYLAVHIKDAGPGSLRRGIPFILSWAWRLLHIDLILVAGGCLAVIFNRMSLKGRSRH